MRALWNPADEGAKPCADIPEKKTSRETNQHLENATSHVRTRNQGGIETMEEAATSKAETIVGRLRRSQRERDRTDHRREIRDGDQF